MNEWIHHMGALLHSGRGRGSGIKNGARCCGVVESGAACVHVDHQSNKTRDYNESGERRLLT